MTRFWLGTAGWSYLPDWAGSFYPAGTSASDTFARYVEAFPFVEVDSTFYAAPAPATVQRWASIAPAQFRMSFKAPRELVQDTGLRPPEIPFGHFAAMLLDGLGERVARIVVQMPPSFARTRDNDVALRTFVDLWGPRVPLAIEFRHLSWRVKAVDEVLRNADVTWASNDVHDVADLGPGFHDTSNNAAYIRLIGRHDGMSKDRIQRPQEQARRWWVDRFVELRERGVAHVYVVVNNHYEGHAPSTLRTLATELRVHDLDVVAHTGWPDGQVSLF